MRHTDVGALIDRSPHDVSCGVLPDSGGPALILLILAGLLLAAGTLLLFLTRTRRTTTRAALVCLMLLGNGAVIVSAGSPPAQASSPGCPSQEGTGRDSQGGDQRLNPSDARGRAEANNSLTITQTSTMVGLAPGITPVPITGRVQNNADDSTSVAAITVSIVSVTKKAGAPNGTCDASDYTLVAPQMPVGQVLGPHDFADFAGASIGFSNKSTNQDACKRATVNLRYESSSPAARLGRAG